MCSMCSVHTNDKDDVSRRKLASCKGCYALVLVLPAWLNKNDTAAFAIDSLEAINTASCLGPSQWHLNALSK